MKMKTIGAVGVTLVMGLMLCGCTGIEEGFEETNASQVAESPYAPAIAENAATGSDTTEGDAYVEEATPEEVAAAEEAEITYQDAEEPAANSVAVEEQESAS